MTDSARRKIAALLGMTRGAGCSEAEAISAAQKAARLMAEHGLSKADVLFTAQSARSKTRGRSVRDRLWGALAFNTNTALVFEEGAATFVGQGPGPDIAAHLFVVLNRAIDREVATYKKTGNYSRRRSVGSKRRAVQDFTAAMALRLHLKLSDLFADVRSKPAQDAAVAARGRMFPGGQPVTAAPAPLRNRIAVSLGDQAGGRVNLNHSVGANASAPRLLS